MIIVNQECFFRPEKIMIPDKIFIRKRIGDISVLKISKRKISEPKRLAQILKKNNSKRYV